MVDASQLALGRYPTPVEHVPSLSTRKTALWIKRDDRTHDVYGGNKVRKLERLLFDAGAAGAGRILTIGAAGSHHVLATTYFGTRAGFEVAAVLVPQPRTEHVVDVLRAGLALGLQPLPVRSWAAVPWRVARAAGRATRIVPVGGSNVAGSMGYVDAARELAVQVRSGALPEPDVCVVALGSGGTAAGLAAGFALEGLKTRVVGVCVSAPPWALRVASFYLARRCFTRGLAARLGRGEGAVARASMRGRLTVDTRFLGAGYGHATAEGAAATALAQDAAGVTLDPTYTAKTFAAALARVDAGREPTVLYWHTLSSAPMQPLLEGAPAERDLAPALRDLLL